MHIGYIYNLKVSPPRGGNHVHALELIQGFLRAGHQVSVIDDPTVPDAQNFNSSESGAVQAFVDNIDILYVRIDARFISQWPAGQLCMSLINPKPVVWEINAPSNEALAYSWLGGRYDGSGEPFFRRMKRWIHATRKKIGIAREERFRRALAKNVDVAICVSSALAEYASQALRLDSVVTLPNGGPLISEKEILSKRATRDCSAFTVFYSGSAIYPWQGMNFMSAVIELARVKAPDIRFVLAVNQKTPNLPDGSNVDIREGLDRDGIIEAVCCADACVALHPDYPWSPYGFHNSPMKLFEYMACMTPVVTSNRAQMAELIEHKKNGLLCSDDAEDTLRQILFLKDNPDIADEIARNGWLIIQNGMSWNDNVNRTLQEFKNLTYCSD
ncbi:glycosyltransferase family 4 protein [Marinobacter salarius]|uniref:glycosyltransferase family 4 protein n=1 Tax=Marinobacter salarius TaxID=1420917 RepID=UPI003D0C35DA